MSTLFDRAVSVLLTLSAIAIAVVLIRNEVRRADTSSRLSRPSSYMPEWKSLLPAGRLIGKSDAPVTIVEFFDLECPFCRRFNEAVKAVRVQHPNDVNLYLIQFPLSSHRYGQPAARAAECAATEGRFSQIVDVMYADQDSLGAAPWSTFASKAGIQDIKAFSRCMSDTSSFPKIQAGIEAGRNIRLSGTPTVILNGWRYGIAPVDSELSRAVNDILAKRKPYNGFPLDALGPGSN